MVYSVNHCTLSGAGPTLTIRFTTLTNMLIIILLVMNAAVHAQVSQLAKQYIKPANPEADDVFGVSVAMDGNYVVVGSSGQSSCDFNEFTVQCPNVGAVYVFQEFSPLSYGQQAFLKPFVVSNVSNTNLGFGRNVAISGNVIAVSDVTDSSCNNFMTTYVTETTTSASLNCTASGAVFVYEVIGIDWQPTVKLKASNSEAGDSFGDCVALHGQWLVVGASLEDSCNTSVPSGNECSKAGILYVYKRSSESAWFEHTRLKLKYADAFDLLGASCSISNGTDGVLRIAGGAVNEASCSKNVANTFASQLNNGCLQSGAVVVWKLDNDEWLEEAFVKSSNTEEPDSLNTGAKFGSSIALYNDFLIVGAPYEDFCGGGITSESSFTVASSDQCRNSGAAYLYSRNSSGWQFEHYLKSSSGASINDQFGAAVAMTLDTIVIGEPGFATFTGAAHVIVVDSFGLWRFLDAQFVPNLSTFFKLGESASATLSDFGIKIGVGAVGESSWTPLTISHSSPFSSGSGSCSNAGVLWTMLRDPPTVAPTPSPSNPPSPFPSPFPSQFPTNLPSPLPTMWPSFPPTLRPTRFPTHMPTPFPTPKPTSPPTLEKRCIAPQHPRFFSSDDLRFGSFTPDCCTRQLLGDYDAKEDGELGVYISDGNYDIEWDDNHIIGWFFNASELSLDCDMTFSIWMDQVLEHDNFVKCYATLVEAEDANNLNPEEISKKKIEQKLNGWEYVTFDFYRMQYTFGKDRFLGILMQCSDDPSGTNDAKVAYDSEQYSAVLRCTCDATSAPTQSPSPPTPVPTTPPPTNYPTPFPSFQPSPFPAPGGPTPFPTPIVPTNYPTFHPTFAVQPPPPPTIPTFSPTKGGPANCAACSVAFRGTSAWCRCCGFQCVPFVLDGPSGCKASGYCNASHSTPFCFAYTDAQGLPYCDTPITPHPTSYPTYLPTMFPSPAPSSIPTKYPTEQPSTGPTLAPTVSPSLQPTTSPSLQPTHAPTKSPTISPSASPSELPTAMPSEFPTDFPTKMPTKNPTVSPSQDPTSSPSRRPTPFPTKLPTLSPSKRPTGSPSPAPTVTPGNPTPFPTPPTPLPSKAPSPSPSNRPTVAPSAGPTRSPSANPSISPSAEPSVAPSRTPTAAPTLSPSSPPTVTPTPAPTGTPCDHDTCVECVSEGNCGWCISSSTCLPGTVAGPSNNVTCVGWNFFFDAQCLVPPPPPTDVSTPQPPPSTTSETSTSTGGISPTSTAASATTTSSSVDCGTLSGYSSSGSSSVGVSNSSVTVSDGCNGAIKFEALPFGAQVVIMADGAIGVRSSRKRADTDFIEGDEELVVTVRQGYSLSTLLLNGLQNGGGAIIKFTPHTSDASQSSKLVIDNYSSFELIDGGSDFSVKSNSDAAVSLVSFTSRIAVATSSTSTDSSSTSGAVTPLSSSSSSGSSATGTTTTTATPDTADPIVDMSSPGFLSTTMIIIIAVVAVVVVALLLLLLVCLLRRKRKTPALPETPSEMVDISSITADSSPPLPRSDSVYQPVPEKKAKSSTHIATRARKKDKTTKRDSLDSVATSSTVATADTAAAATTTAAVSPAKKGGKKKSRKGALADKEYTLPKKARERERKKERAAERGDAGEESKQMSRKKKTKVIEVVWEKDSESDTGSSGTGSESGSGTRAQMRKGKVTEFFDSPGTAELQYLADDDNETQITYGTLPKDSMKTMDLPTVELEGFKGELPKKGGSEKKGKKDGPYHDGSLIRKKKNAGAYESAGTLLRMSEKTRKEREKAREESDDQTGRDSDNEILVEKAQKRPPNVSGYEEIDLKWVCKYCHNFNLANSVACAGCDREKAVESLNSSEMRKLKEAGYSGLPQHLATVFTPFQTPTSASTATGSSGGSTMGHSNQAGKFLWGACRRHEECEEYVRVGNVAGPCGICSCLPAEHEKLGLAPGSTLHRRNDGESSWSGGRTASGGGGGAGSGERRRRGEDSSDSTSLFHRPSVDSGDGSPPQLPTGSNSPPMPPDEPSTTPPYSATPPKSYS